MERIVTIGAAQDHIESQTKSSPLLALKELLWNALDADATHISILFETGELGNYEYIKIKDDGHGIHRKDVDRIFSSLGGSDKKSRLVSPGGRKYHGKKGKGRLKSLSLGSHVKFKSIYIDEVSEYKDLTIQLANDAIKNASISEERSASSPSGVEVIIHDIYTERANALFLGEKLKELEDELAVSFVSYWMAYKNFSMDINGKVIDFEELQSNIKSYPFSRVINGIEKQFEVKVVEWKTNKTNKKTYLCDSIGLPIRELPLGFRTEFPISIYIESSYFSELEDNETLDLVLQSAEIKSILKNAKTIGQDYVRDKLHESSFNYISQLKTKKVYPFSEDPKTPVEKSTQQMFDIVAINIHQHIPSFDKQGADEQRLTFALIKEVIETDSESLNRILVNVLKLPIKKQKEFSDLLVKMPLTNIIDTMSLVQDRLNFLSGLENMIFNPQINSLIKERSHLHKILVNETWIFGDEFAYGADDITLKNVLLSYLKYLDRTSLIGFSEGCEIEEVNDPDGMLATIPDICLWKQFNQGNPEYRENLIIELKRPTVNAGLKELAQIQGYAAKISSDSRFPKEKTHWTFFLITKEIKEEIMNQVNQSQRPFGLVTVSKEVSVWVVRWSDIINKAKARLNFLKEKLNLQIETNESGIKYLRDKYSQYLPDNEL